MTIDAFYCCTYRDFKVSNILFIVDQRLVDHYSVKGVRRDEGGVAVHGAAAVGQATHGHRRCAGAAAGVNV